MSTESFPETDQPSTIRRVLHLFNGQGRGFVIPRVGGGINVAVFPFDPEHPEDTIEKYIALRRGRGACPMPFDDPNYVLEPDAIQTTIDLGEE